MDESRKTLEELVDIVRSEPELPGPMPDNVKLQAYEDIEEYSRSVVRATKESIINRLWMNGYVR